MEDSNMGNSLFDDMMVGAVVAKHLFRGASKAYAKTKQLAESEKGQQLKAEIRAKTNEAIDLAGSKAKELGLEAKAKYALEFAKDMILNNSSEMPPDVQAIVYGPGGYAEKINDLERRIAEETENHERILEELNQQLANAPEYIELSEYGPGEEIPATANVYEQKIQEEQERFEYLSAHLQEELNNLKEELEEGLFMERQRCREEAYEEELRREENARDWAIFIGEDPDKYR